MLVHFPDVCNEGHMVPKSIQVPAVSGNDTSTSQPPDQEADLETEQPGRELAL